MFITALTSARHLFLSRSRQIQCVPPHPTYWRSVLILLCHLRRGLPSCYILSGLPPQTQHTTAQTSDSVYQRDTDKCCHMSIGHHLINALWTTEITHCILRLFALAVSGVAHPGELLAIMGASGAGKTTLLNTLMFRSLPNIEVSGRRAVNGVSVTCSTVASLAAYVQQDDLFIGTLTVREHLVFQVLMTVVRPESLIDPRLNKLGSIYHAQLIKLLVLPVAFVWVLMKQWYLRKSLWKVKVKVFLSTPWGGWDSSVSIVTRLWVGWSGVRIPAGWRD